MINALSWKVGLSLAALFGLGAASGFVVARRLEPPPAPGVHILRPPNPSNTVYRAEQAARRWREKQFNLYKSVIKPTPDQEVFMQAQFDLLAREHARIQADTRREMQRAAQQLQKNIAAELTPEQRKAFGNHLRKAEKREDSKY